MPAIQPILCHGLASLGAQGVAHGFFTRAGGVSQGLYRGLNVGLGSDDSREAVLENRAHVGRWLGVRDGIVATAHQTHSCDVVTVDQPWTLETRPTADAAVTNRPGIALGVLTADCGPVLFADAEAGVIGATHAGWKGATGGILENTIAAMERMGAKRERIAATLGPTITARAYEVGPEFVERLTGLDEGNRRFLSPSPRAGHAMFDLPGYIVARLETAGVTARFTGQCTYGDEGRFFSFRRTTHRGEPDYGRQISAIILRS